MALYFRLFYEFFKTGLFAIGGGLATLPFLYDMSDKTGWFTHLQLVDMVAVAESTPGPIGINMATYVGYTVRGVPGSVIATIGLITPSIIIILMIAKLLSHFNENPYVQKALYGLRAASIALITAALLLVAKLALLHPEALEAKNYMGLVDLPSLLLAGCVFLVMKKWNPHPIVVIAASAVVGILFQF